LHPEPQPSNSYHNSKSQQYYQTKPKVVNWEHELTKSGYCTRNLIILIFSTKKKLMGRAHHSISYKIKNIERPGGRRGLSPPAAPGFESSCARLSSPRCLTCPLGLQGVQWAVGLVVVRASWPGHPRKSKKKKKKEEHWKIPWK
jgi:hypothetical protein